MKKFYVKPGHESKNEPTEGYTLMEIPAQNAELEQRIIVLENNMILDQQLILENSQRITDLEEIVEELVKKLEQK